MAKDPKKRRWLSDKARRRIKRALLGIAVAIPILGAAMWYAANNVPWFGAWMADTLRSLIGTEAVADLEEVTYDLQDRWNRFWREGEKPKSYWDSPGNGNGTAAPADSGTPSAPAPGTGQAPSGQPSSGQAPSGQPSSGQAPSSAFPPRDPGPFESKYAAAGDGAWAPVSLPESPTEAPLLYKTLLHPDPKRPWAEVFVVAVDATRALLVAIAGTQEPRGTAPGASDAKRTGLIPDADVANLLAGFNGGFKEEHGHYGMKIDGVLLVRPRADACTIGMGTDDSLKIASWKVAKDIESTFRWWRQTPACLIEATKLHPALYDENTNWGAALGGGTVVRRSALGVDATGKVLFVAVSNATTPRTIALAMQHAGAVDAAQLDINYSYPRFVTFPKNPSGERETTSLFDGFKVDKDDYLRGASLRDFFYLVRKPPPETR